MIRLVNHSKISGRISVPSSKSLMIRALAMAFLSESATTLLNPNYCQDTLAAINILKSFGCLVHQEKEKITIEKGKLQIPDEISCEESALSLRLFAPIVALNEKPIWLTAKGSLQKRPAEFMTKTFRQLGVKFNTTKGFPPLHILGSITEAEANVQANESSQFLSGLLMALPKTKINNINLYVSDLVSLPYVQMTIDIIEKFGGKITYNTDYSEFSISGNQNYSCDTYSIEADWSAAANLLVAGAIGGELRIEQISSTSKQADKEILKAISQSGAKIKETERDIIVTTNEKLKAFNFNAIHCPDLFPPLVALAANSEGISRISGRSRLKHKESDRALVLQQEFAKMGIKITFEADDMLIEGGVIKTAETYAHNDHRIAMAIAVAAIKAENTVSIKGAECVEKTYPNFFEDMIKIGVKITKNE